MPQENQPVVVVAKWFAGSSRRPRDGDDLLENRSLEIEKLLRQLRYGNDLTARATSDFEEFFHLKRWPKRLTNVAEEREPADELFSHEKDCQKIVLAFAKKNVGYDYPTRDRTTIRRLCDTTERHGCKLVRDTIGPILQEVDPRTGRWRDRRNRQKSYYKLIYALAHEFCADDEEGLSPQAPEKIATLVRGQGDAIEVEAVRQILKVAKQAVDANV